MTVLIAHRGNLDGPNPSRENHPDYILEAINQGYMVEIDLRMFNGVPMLGHDEAQYEIDDEFLQKYKSFLWVHCKDVAAFDFVQRNPNNNYFWHDKDSYTMTSWNYTWAYPGMGPVGNLCVMVMPELHWPIEEFGKFKPFGFCSDYVRQIKL